MMTPATKPDAVDPVGSDAVADPRPRAPESNALSELTSLRSQVQRLEEWKAHQQTGLLSMATQLLGTGFTGTGIVDGIKYLKDQLQEKDAEVQRLTELSERLKSEAQIHAQEARTQRSIVHECYQAVGAQRGDWNGAQPVREAFQKLEAALQRRSWQPIETAPKDGPALLTWTHPWAIPEVSIWLDGPVVGEPGWHSYQTNRRWSYQPTHWMPLPNPPSPREGR